MVLSENSLIPVYIIPFQVRRGFIRKVYGILTIQLAITAVFICCFIFIDSLRLYALRSRVLYWVAFAVMMVRFLNPD